MTIFAESFLTFSIMPKYRKKPVVVDALRWQGDWNMLEAWINTLSSQHVDLSKKRAMHLASDGSIVIDTLEGKMRCEIDDFIICGVDGEYYPCKPDIFIRTYDEL